ncbi:MAG: chemotaxis protein CheB [Pseudobdellovibrionaceae bacterium]
MKPVKKPRGKKIAKPRPDTSSSSFPIVGIGASAGGLEAFIQVLSKMPIDTGMAFVLMQHLDPTHPSLSVDIISRSTQLKVEEVTDGIRVQSNHVYVIPPNFNMGFLDGVLKLSPRDSAPGQNMPIDFFLQSLARSENRKAIGVVLSGTGTDGTAGLWAIKAEGGITYAQDPDSAKYAGMPQSAIKAGVVDQILRPIEITKELSRIATHPYLVFEEAGLHSEKLADEMFPQEIHQEALQKIFTLLKARTKTDFANYKQTTIMRRIRRRMMVQKAKSLQDYAKYLQANEDEVQALYNDILINVTNFFRDPESYKALADLVFPSLLKNKPAGSPIRIWVPGCSTGEEAYSIAICLVEFLIQVGKQNPIQIFATDISEQAVQKARIGQYSESVVQNVTKERLKRFFDKTDGGYKIHKEIRDLCLFSRHDVTNDPPFAKLDLISCRNVLIYFAKALQKRVIPIFHYGLLPSGFLWLGRAENLGEFSKLFSSVEKTHKIYSKSNVPTPQIYLSTQHLRQSPGMKTNGQAFAKDGREFHRDADKIILSKFSPPSVIVNSDLEILQFRGRTVPFLEPAAGQPSLNLLKMVRPELLASLRTAIQSVKKENKSIERQGLHFEVDGKYIKVDIEVLPINPKGPSKDHTFLVLFKENRDSEKTLVGKKLKGKKRGSKQIQDDKDQRISELMKELLETKEYQQSLVEQYEATQEELTSANEELQSTNEEFQSTNEEIETAKEELQSTNEELVTVNEELEVRNADLTTLSSDLNNLLASIEVPVLIVGGNHRIRRYSPKAKSAFNLIPTDIGRPIGDIKPKFDLDLDGLVSEVGETLTAKEIEIQDSNGSWSRVQIRPYRTVDNKIDGAIIVLTDIDLLKKREGKTQEARTQADKANLAKDIFLATLSHELRTPLSSILTWAQLISQGKVDFEKAKQGAAVIEQSAKTQNQLIDDLLDISRITAGKLAIDMKSTDLVSVTRTAIESVRSMSEKKSIQIETDFPTESTMIHADPVRLQQIVWNLLTNAIKFSPKKSVINIELKKNEKQNKSFAQIKVSDQGKGIPPEFLPHIFKQFSQADSTSTRTHGGLGLGLSIVHSLVELQNGTIRAENASDGKGAIFTVIFPLISPQPRVTRSESSVEAKTKDHPPKLDGSRILLVDDNESAREAISLYLKAFGAEVMPVGSVAEALEMLLTFKPTILISDIAMPGEDGYSLIRKVRSLSLSEGGDIPALALSACATEEDARYALASGFQAHIAKPVEANELGRAILKFSGKKSD